MARQRLRRGARRGGAEQQRCRDERGGNQTGHAQTWRAPLAWQGVALARRLGGRHRARHRPAATVAQEEVFGPVLALSPFDDEEDAIRIANGTEFGLVAGVWTKDGSRQHRVAKRVRAGQVFVNGYGAGGGVELPFGGFKKSGHGREKGFDALYDMSATKTIVFNHG